MIRIVCAGKIKDKHLSALIEDYRERISHYHKIEVIEVKDEPIRDDEKDVLKKEGDRMLEKIGKDEYVILLDLHGHMCDSVRFASQLDKLFITYPKITFVIGGSLGLSPELIARSNDRICLSPMTFPHQVARMLLLEQIYRSFKILNHETYHK